MIPFVIGVITGYVSFGLGLYALGAVVSLIIAVWRHKPLCAPSHRDAVQVCLSVIALLVVDVSRLIWNTFESQHLSIWITRLTLPLLYVALGNALFRISSAGMPDCSAPPKPMAEAAGAVQSVS